MEVDRADSRSVSAKLARLQSCDTTFTATIAPRHLPAIILRHFTGPIMEQAAPLDVPAHKLRHAPQQNILTEAETLCRQGLR